MVPASFFAELEKQAVSMGRTLAAVQRRVAQGATVGPKALAELHAGAAAGLTSTPKGARRIAAYAAEGGKAQQATNQMLNNPVAQATKQRLNEGSAAARGGRPGVYDVSKPTSHHYDYGPNPDAGMGYTKAHMDRMAGQSQLVDPKGLIPASNRAAVGNARTMAPPPPAAGRMGTAVTAVSGVQPSPALRGGTAVTSVTGTGASGVRPRQAQIRQRQAIGMAPTLPPPAMAAG